MTELALDIRTLSYLTVLLAVLYGTGMLLVSILQHSFSGLRTYSVAIYSIGAGFLLLAFRDAIQTWLSVITANACIALGFHLMYEGLLRFRGSPPKHVPIRTALLLLLLPLFLYHTYVLPSVALRIVWISLFIALQSALCTWILLSSKHRDLLPAQWMTALPFMFSCLFFLFRALWAISETGLNNFMQAGTIHQLAFISINIIVITSCFGILWMASARLENELRDQARIDTLTKLYNRRALQEIVPRELSRAQRHDLPLSLIAFDLDHFKRVNDVHGHHTGDIVLATTASIMTSNVRAQDVLVRNGGEEFLIILPDTTLQQGIATAEKLRIKLEQSVLCTDPEVRATASFGVASLSPRDTWETLSMRADAILYKAKNNGRNRVESG